VAPSVTGEKPVAEVRRRYTTKAEDIGGYDSKQERTIHRLYPQLQYHPPIRLEYTIETWWPPDFRLGKDRETGLNVYIECKEWFDGRDAGKYEAVVNCNSGAILLIICKKISPPSLKRLNLHPRIFCYESGYNLPLEWILRCANT
jgi:hypothetical protein